MISDGHHPELSCYTTNLVAYLGAGAEQDLAAAVRLAVRTDLADGALAFSHHHRIDGDRTTWQLGYRGAADWSAARQALAAEIDAHGAVLAVGNTRHLPWAPTAVAEVPHWILVHRRDDGRWTVRDDFAALLPSGEWHRPWSGTLSDQELGATLTPVDRPGTAVRLRDEHALGAATSLPGGSGFRWLGRVPRTPRKQAAGTWLTDPVAVLEHLADRMARDRRTLTEHCDDLWAAARHQRFRLAATGSAGERVRAAAESWAQLPKLLRFAAESAARGRPRPSVITKAFAAVTAATRAVLDARDPVGSP